uniref:Uncharacterized protein n=1 Tax=Glossina palpalis gambiensis TaxID=67801 RepID=A0A1B0BE69_9MUSC
MNFGQKGQQQRLNMFGHGLDPSLESGESSIRKTILPSGIKATSQVRSFSSKVGGIKGFIYGPPWPTEWLLPLGMAAAGITGSGPTPDVAILPTVLLTAGTFSSTTIMPP